jgi:hypothetical protein
VVSVPRLLTSAGQGYGYAVAWCLAQLLQPALLQQVHEALAAQQQQQQQQQEEEFATCRAGALGSVFYSSSSTYSQDLGQTLAIQHVPTESRRHLWRQFLSQGAGLADAVELVSWVVLLQDQHADVAHGTVGSDSSSSSSASGVVADALREHGMWPLERGVLHPSDVLGVCLGCALEQIMRTEASP